jgi:hypothetical protein
MRRIKRLARWGLWSAAGLILLLVGLNFALPVVVNTKPIKAKLTEGLNHAIAGQARIGGIELHLLPLPGLILTQVHYDLPGRVSLQADAVAVYPKIAPLLFGHLKIGRVRVLSPVAIVHLPVHAAARASGRPHLPDRSELISALTRIPADLSFGLVKGQITFLRGAHEEAHIRSLSLMLAKTARLHAEVEGKSDWADRFYLQAELDPSTLNGSGRLDVSGARIAKWESALHPASAELTADAAVDLHASVRSRGLQSIHIAFNGTAPVVTLARGQASVRGSHFSIQGSASITPQRWRAEVSELSLDQPKLHMNGSLLWLRHSGPGPVPLQLSLKAQDSDVTAVRDAVLRLAGKRADTIALFQVVRGGTLVSMTLNASGSSLSALGRSKNMQVSGRAADAQIFIPDMDLDLTNVGGDWQFAEEILSVRQAAAQWGRTRAQNGSLKLGLHKANKFIELDVDLAADLAQLKPFLTKAIKQPSVQAELARLKSIQGSAEGHLSLSGPFDDLKVNVMASDFAFTADDDRLPYPVRMQGRGLTLTREGLTLAQGDVRMSHSAIKGLGGRMTFRREPRIDIHSASARLDWNQLYPWLARQAHVRKRFNFIKDIGGRLRLTHTRLEGPLSDISKWYYATSGTPMNLTILSPKLPGQLTMTHGTFKVMPERISFSDIRFLVLDSSIEARGTIDEYRTPRPRVTVGGRGVVGDQAAQWLQQTFNVPKALVMRAPVDIKNADISWQRQAEIRVKGAFNLPGDLNLGCALTFGPDGFDLQRLTLTDALSNARMALQYNKVQGVWALSYSGCLLNATLAKLFRHDTLYAERIEGDFSAHVRMDHPEDDHLQGRLQGRNLILPDLSWGELFIQQFDLSAHQKVLEIQRLAFALDEQRASISGEADFSGREIALNIALQADTLDLDRPVEQIKTSIQRHASPAEQQTGAMPKWTAHIEVAAQRLKYAGFTLQPLRAVLALRNKRADVRVQEANLCGINVQGKGNWTPEGMSVDFEPRSSGRTIQFVTGCLMGAEPMERIEGTYTIDGRLESRGATTEALLRNLQGMVHITAVDGRVLSLKGIGFFSNLLSYLQINNLVTGKLPNLREQGFEFNRIHSELEFKDGLAEMKELRVMSGGLNMVAGGSINLLDRQMNMTVLVSPLTTLDAIIRHIPIVGRILKGTLVAIPVGVYGPVTNPEVRPLSPKAVGSRLLGIMERILQTPLKLIEPILPKSK